MKKITAMLLVMVMLVGMYSVSTFATSDNGNGNGNGPVLDNPSKNEDIAKSGLEADESNEKDSHGYRSAITPAALGSVTPPAIGTTTPPAVVSPAAAEVNAYAEIALLNKDASKDLSIGNTEDNADRVKREDLRAFKGEFTTQFAVLNGLRTTARDNWKILRSLNEQIKADFAKYRLSLKSLPKADADAKMAALRDSLKTTHVSGAAIHADILALRTQKTQEWAKYRTAVKSARHLSSTDPAYTAAKTAAETALKEIIRLKGEIITHQTELVALKNSILAIIPTNP